MMMQIHTDAIRLSRIGSKPCYIVSKGAYHTFCRHNSKLLELLRDGYQLQRKYVNGAGEYSIRIVEDTPYGQAAINAISSALFGREDVLTGLPVIISVQEFFDEAALRHECTYMYITSWKKGIPATLWVTPKDKVVDPDGFAEGQRKAEKVLDIAQLFHLKPYTKDLLYQLELDKKAGALK